MKKRWVLLSILGVAVLALTLLLLFHEGTRSVLLDPLVRSFESAVYIYRSVPQAIVWAALLALGGIHIILRWPRRQLKPLRSRVRDGAAQGESTWTLIRLTNLLADAQRKRSSRAGIVRVLADTAVHLIARHHSISPIEARDLLLAKTWTDNQEIAEFLATRTLAEPVPKEGFEEKLRRTIEFLESYYQEV